MAGWLTYVWGKWHTGGDTLGMRRAAERLAETPAEKYDVEVELHAANELVQQMVNQQAVHKPMFKVRWPRQSQHRSGLRAATAPPCREESVK